MFYCEVEVTKERGRERMGQGELSDHRADRTESLPPEDRTLEQRLPFRGVLHLEEMTRP